MNRRNFLNSLIGGIAATAAVRTWPFRVYSFPSDLTWAGTDILRHSLRIPIRKHTGIVLRQSDSMLGRGTGSQWEVVTVYSQKELDDVVSKYEATQEPEWAALIRSLPDPRYSELARDPTWNRL